MSHNKETYTVIHEPSASITQVICILDRNKEPRITSIKLLYGKVAPLSGVKQALQQFKQERACNEPDQSA